MKYEKMPFGKYKGVYISEIPTNYLVYAIEEFDLPEELQTGIRDEVLGRLGPISSDTVDIFNRVKNVYRTLCKKYHPDAGGSTGEMQAINEFYNSLISGS